MTRARQKALGGELMPKRYAMLSTEPAERPSAAEARAQLAALLPPGAPLRAEGPARSSDDPDI